MKTHCLIQSFRELIHDILFQRRYARLPRAQMHGLHLSTIAKGAFFMGLTVSPKFFKLKRIKRK